MQWRALSWAKYSSPWRLEVRIPHPGCLPLRSPRGRSLYLPIELTSRCPIQRGIRRYNKHKNIQRKPMQANSSQPNPTFNKGPIFWRKKQHSEIRDRVKDKSIKLKRNRDDSRDSSEPTKITEARFLESFMRILYLYIKPSPLWK